MSISLASAGVAFFFAVASLCTTRLAPFWSEKRMSAAARSAMKASTVVFFVAAGKISASSGVSVSGESLPCSMMMRMAARSYTQPSLAMTGSVRSMSVTGQQSSAGSTRRSSRVRCLSLLSTRPAT